MTQVTSSQLPVDHSLCLRSGQPDPTNEPSSIRSRSVVHRCPSRPTYWHSSAHTVH